MPEHIFKHKEFQKYVIAGGVSIAVLVGLLGFALYQIYAVNTRVELLSADLASTTDALYRETGGLAQTLADVRSQTLGLSSNLSTTQQNIASVQNQVGGVMQTLGTVSGTVDTLQKLTHTDPELLKKYSKVYFLNENYTPAHLTDVPQTYVYSDTRQERFLTEAWGYLKAMLDAAKADGMTLYIKSAFRSFNEQQSLKSAYTVVFGAGTANSFSADQGYSEHQLGTAVDVITSGMNGQLVLQFDQTTAFQWLKANAYKYGFELSYPSGNAYYVYEPWHWRFVGVKLATYLHNQNMNFYGIDQRDIDAYLADLFD